MLNRIILMGRLTRDPELRHTQTGTAVASFSLAVDRDFKDKAPATAPPISLMWLLAADRRVCQPLLHQGPHGCGGGPAPDPGLDG